jgi:hypothetical protein
MAMLSCVEMILAPLNLLVARHRHDGCQLDRANESALVCAFQSEQKF